MLFNKVILTILFCFPVFAQEASDSTTYPIQEGYRALQFRMSSLLNFSSFTGSTISYKVQKPDMKATRIGISNYGNYSIEDTEYKIQGTDSQDSSSSETYSNDESDVSNYQIFVYLEYLKYEQKKDNLFFYRGMGPRIGFTYHSIKNFSSNTSNSFEADIVLESKNPNIYIGMTYVVGFEWFLNDFISYHLEYRPYANLRIGTTEETYERNYYTDNRYSKLETNHFEFVIINNVRAGISIYFE